MPRTDRQVLSGQRPAKSSLGVGENVGGFAEGFDAENIMPMSFQKLRATRLIAEGLAATVLAAGLSIGASVACAQRQPETFFKTRIGLSDSEIQKMGHGQVVTKVLESGDKKYGILVFGGVYINTSIEQFAASYRDVKSLLEDKVHLDVDEFSENGAVPKFSDFDRLTLSHKDIDTIQNCRPNHCDFQVFVVSAFQKQSLFQSLDIPYSDSPRAPLLLTSPFTYLLRLGRELSHARYRCFWDTLASFKMRRKSDHPLRIVRLS